MERFWTEPSDDRRCQPKGDRHGDIHIIWHYHRTLRKPGTWTIGSLDRGSSDGRRSPSTAQPFMLRRRAVALSQHRRNDVDIGFSVRIPTSGRPFPRLDAAIARVVEGRMVAAKLTTTDWLGPFPNRSEAFARADRTGLKKVRGCGHGRPRSERTQPSGGRSGLGAGLCDSAPKTVPKFGSGEAGGCRSRPADG
jgi:hypothetical protein